MVSDEGSAEMDLLAGAAALLLAGTIAAAAGPPAGGYRVTLARADLLRAGDSAREAGWGAGTWTLTLAPGRWTLRQAQGANGNTVDRGTLAVTGGRAAFTLRSADGYAHNEDVGTLTWRSGARTLRFAPAVRARNRDLLAVLSARSWRRL
jgi:hypothetical protein